MPINSGDALTDVARSKLKLRRISENLLATSESNAFSELHILWEFLQSDDSVRPIFEELRQVDFDYPAWLTHARDARGFEFPTNERDRAAMCLAILNPSNFEDADGLWNVALDAWLTDSKRIDGMIRDFFRAFVPPLYEYLEERLDDSSSIAAAPVVDQTSVSTLRSDIAELTATRYATGFECQLKGTREMAESATISAAGKFVLEDFRFKAERAKFRHGQPIITVRAERQSPSAGGSIGILEFVDAPGENVWLRVPQYRGSPATGAWKPDDDNGTMFSAFLSYLLDELGRLGFGLTTSRGRAIALLQSAAEQLGSAADAATLIGVANVCRSSLIQLANDVYKEHMKPETAESPKGDEADTKLKYFVAFCLSTISQRYRVALQETAQAVWDLVSAAVHRKNVTLADSRGCVGLSIALAESIYLLSQADT